MPRSIRPGKTRTHPMAEATPRVSANYLERFSGQTVRLIGKVTQLRGESALIDADGTVQVLVNRVSI